MVKVICEECKNKTRTRGVKIYLGKQYCYRCYYKKINKENNYTQIANYVKNNKKIEEEQNKIRHVNGYLTKKGLMHCVVSLPCCYYGKEVMVKVV